jgi:hypothetical protein
MVIKKWFDVKSVKLHPCKKIFNWVGRFEKKIKRIETKE